MYYNVPHVIWIRIIKSYCVFNVEWIFIWRGGLSKDDPKQAIGSSYTMRLLCDQMCLVWVDFTH